MTSTEPAKASVLPELSVRQNREALAFVTKQAEIEPLARAFAKKAEGDAVIWFAYPKGTSKRYTCDINRDTGWNALGDGVFALGWVPRIADKDAAPALLQVLVHGKTWLAAPGTHHIAVE